MRIVTIEKAIDAINSFRSPDSEVAVDALEQALKFFDDKHVGPLPLEAVQSILRLFRRCPTGDVYGLFWTALHIIEKHPGSYEEALVEAVASGTPGEFEARLVNRLLSSDITRVGNVDLNELAESMG